MSNFLRYLNTGANLVTAIKSAQIAAASKSQARMMQEQGAMLHAQQQSEALQEQRREILFQLSQQADRLRTADLGALYLARQIQLILANNGIASSELRLREDKASLLELNQLCRAVEEHVCQEYPQANQWADHLIYVREQLGPALQRVLVLEHATKLPRVPENRAKQVLGVALALVSGLFMVAGFHENAVVMGLMGLAAMIAFARHAYLGSRKVVAGTEALPEWQRELLPGSNRPSDIEAELRHALTQVPAGDIETQLQECEATLEEASRVADTVEAWKWFRPASQAS